MPIKKLLEESCVRNFRNPLFAKLLLFEILGHFQKLFWAKILGVRNFRVFEILGHLPYFNRCVFVMDSVKVFTLSIGTPQLLTILILNFEQVQFTSDVVSKNCWMSVKQ